MDENFKYIFSELNNINGNIKNYRNEINNKYIIMENKQNLPFKEINIKKINIVIKN